MLEALNAEAYKETHPETSQAPSSGLWFAPGFNAKELLQMIRIKTEKIIVEADFDDPEKLVAWVGKNPSEIFEGDFVAMFTIERPDTQEARFSVTAEIVDAFTRERKLEIIRDQVGSVKELEDFVEGTFPAVHALTSF